MYDSHLGIPIMPETIIDIAERLGYRTTMVGTRRMISAAALLPHLLGRLGSQGGSSSSSQNSVALSSTSDRSTTIMDVATQPEGTLTLVRQQGLEILGQVTSLRDMVTELSAGQQTLQSKQSDLQEQLAAQASANVTMMQSMISLKSEFLSFQTAQDKKFQVAEEQVKYKESMDKLNELFSEETGAKGLLGAMDTDNV